METTIYKLGEYKIIESDTGELRWEAHFGFSEFQEGRCFKKGTILFIGPAENERPGFLKGEFLDHLKQVPEWLKTRYYCRGLEVYHSRTGKKVSMDEMRLWMFDKGREGETMAFSGKPGDDSKDLSSLMSKESVDFRMKKYEINKKKNGHVVWKAYAGPSSLRTGTCIILEDILFIGPSQNERTDLSKRQFFTNLKQLPIWDQTKYYCPQFSLHECETANRVFGKKRGWGKKRISPIFDSVANSVARCGERARFFRFKSKKSYISESIAVFRTSGIRRWIADALALIFLTISLFITFVIGYWKDHHKRWQYKKGEHSSSHHREH